MALHVTVRKRPKRIASTRPENAPPWPSWRYHPETGQGFIFQSEDVVPDGWVEHYRDTDPGKAEVEASLSLGHGSFTAPSAHYDDGADDGEPAELERFDDITVATIKKRLDDRGVEYAPGANKGVLYELLEANWTTQGE